jgi:hypothetical protein
LTAEEQDRVLAEMDVANTLWQIIDIIDESSVSDAKYIVISSLFFGVFLGLILSAVAFLKHERPLS